jgi:hypothetical protein
VTQDLRDIIRQEYQHHGITVPARQDLTPVVRSAHFEESEISQSYPTYGLLLGNPGAVGEATRAAFNQLLRSALGNPNFPEQGLLMTSGWRNPQRNEAVGGSPTSIHQYGNAVDLKILNDTVTASGLPVAQLWEILASAGDAVASGFCERQEQNQTIQVLCNDPGGVTHVHVQN